ncbi:beta-galactosidase BglA [Oceanibium sediminis]|uniref:beta-galactosidase BglA n=1 Tax=Oceanibium sediminis TaxID=2026339 RepID=UPI000DD4644B|nr:alpha-glucosidase family protein [Oceanibium sediminis]
MSDSPDKDADWWRGAVIYQIYPRSFQDSDGDGMGDLPGITRRLEHVAMLGADAIWISPFFPSPMKDMGYDVSDYTGVDPMFGSLQDFDDLVARAHALGLKVMIDQVMNHTSDQHAWFRESRLGREGDKADWYVWADPKEDGSAPNNWLSVFGGPAWEWDGVRKQYYLHNFLASQPDLNFHCEAVQDAILETVRFWLERGVDGFRLDTANFFFHDKLLRSNPPVGEQKGPAGIGADAPDVNPYGMQSHLYSKSQPENVAWLERFRALLDEYDGRTSVGEVGDARAIELTAEYTATGKRLHMCYTFDLLSENFSPHFFRRTVKRFEEVVTDGWVCWAFSNHDVVRHASRFAPDHREEVAKLSATLLLSLRGSVCLYQGEELGLGEAEIAYEDVQDPYGLRFWPAFKGRDGCRTPMVWEAGAAQAGFSTGKPWLPVPAEHLPLAVDRQAGRAGSVLEHYRAMLGQRRQSAVLRKGDIGFIDATAQVLAFIRALGEERVLQVFNLSDRPARWSVPDGLSVAGDFPLPGAAAEWRGSSVELPAFGFGARLLD